MKTKLILFFIIPLCFIGKTHGQIEVNSSGNLLTNQHEIYLKHTAGNKYGMGYNAFGASQMVIFSDQYIELRESDANTLCAKFDLNTKKSLFYGDISLNKDHWTGGLNTDIINFSGHNMTALLPNSAWYGTIGTSTKYFAAGYISHMYSNYYDDWPSDGRLKENVRTFSDPIDIIKSLKPVKYDIVESFYDSIPVEAGSDIIISGKNKMGFIAQDLLNSLPEIVHVEPISGYYSVCKVDLIPVIVAALQEQQFIIEDLEKELYSQKSESSSNLKSESISSVQEIDEHGIGPVLYQNQPNPFNENTEICFYIPNDSESALLNIYNMQGNQIKSTILNHRGNGLETIDGSELQPGMYMYTLIVDGQEVDTKRMILTD